MLLSYPIYSVVLMPPKSLALLPLRQKEASVAIRQERKRPRVLLHVTVDDDTYNSMCDLRDELNMPHLNPDSLVLEEVEEVARRVKHIRAIRADSKPSPKQLIREAFTEKKNGTLRVAGKGVLKSPHSMNEVVNLLLTYAVANLDKIALPDRTEWTVQDVEAHLHDFLKI